MDSIEPIHIIQQSLITERLSETLRRFIINKGRKNFQQFRFLDGYLRKMVNFVDEPSNPYHYGHDLSDRNPEFFRNPRGRLHVCGQDRSGL